MRLCKEDSTPSAVLVRKKNADGTLGDIIPAPHPPKPVPTEVSKAESEEEIEVHETQIAIEGGATLQNSEPCVF